MEKITINMLSNADSVKGQGVGSAYLEQVKLIKEGAPDLFEVSINNWQDSMINHFHSVDVMFYLRIKTSDAINVCYVHFLPETLEGSITLPKPIFSTLKHYVIDFYKSADYCIVVNPIFINALMQYDIPRERIVYIPNYVAKNEFFPITDPQRITAIKDEFKIPQNRFIVLGVGQVQTRKGVLDFIEIAKKSPDLSFVWCGGFSFGSITDGYKELKQIIENPPENVQFLDIIPRERMNEMFNMADVLFMPSYNELFPMSILEAANTETPILLRDLDLYKDILFDFYLHAQNNEQFEHELHHLAADPTYYQAIQENSRKISAFYSKENVLQQWIDFYTTIYRNRKTVFDIEIPRSSKIMRNLIQGKQTMMINGSSMSHHPFGKIHENDIVNFTYRGESETYVTARVKEVINYEHFDEDETLSFILKYQSRLHLNAKEIKKFCSKSYLTILDLDHIEILEEPMI